MISPFQYLRHHKKVAVDTESAESQESERQASGEDRRKQDKHRENGRLAADIAKTRGKGMEPHVKTQLLQGHLTDLDQQPRTRVLLQSSTSCLGTPASSKQPVVTCLAELQTTVVSTSLQYYSAIPSSRSKSHPTCFVGSRSFQFCIACIVTTGRPADRLPSVGVT